MSGLHILYLYPTKLTCIPETVANYDTTDESHFCLWYFIIFTSLFGNTASNKLTLCVKLHFLKIGWMMMRWSHAYAYHLCKISHLIVGMTRRYHQTTTLIKTCVIIKFIWSNQTRSLVFTVTVAVSLCIIYVFTNEMYYYNKFIGRGYEKTINEYIVT